jgi:signal transduction histidine kinase
VTFSFAALSLRIPERVQVRYYLEGQDEGWVNPRLRRQAFYTNLGPGRYRFRVIAANENGIWNRSGAVLDVTIPPTFGQSVWFKLLVVLLLGALMGAIYVMRVRQVTAQLQNRFDIRIAERERIARELHDTLLQSVQGLLLQFKAIANRLSENQDLRRSLDAALTRAQNLLIEGRDRVKELRSEGMTAELADALLQRASAALAGDRPGIVLTQEGTSRRLHPLVREELEWIAEEAVRNAVAHAQASTIEILLQWSQRGLRLAIRDDGSGLPASVLAGGRRQGHFGLIGIHERAERIGGILTITSRQAAATEVTVEVPAHAAYEDYRAGLHDRLWSRWRSWARQRSAPPRAPAEG